MHNVKRTFLLAALAATAFGTSVLSQQAPAAGRTALTGATVIDVVAGTTVPNAVIVIEGDKITAFGGSTTPIPAGAARLTRLYECKRRSRAFRTGRPYEEETPPSATGHA